MLSKALYTKLSTTGGITALVGTRIYPVIMPENPTMPLITYQLISEPQVHTFEGVKVQNAIVQFDCWAETYLAAHTLAEAVESAMNDFRGTIGSEEKIHGSLQLGKQDLFQEDVNDYRVSMDYSIWHVPAS